MATLTLSNLGVGAGGASLGEAMRGADSVKRAAFEDAMARSGADPARAADPAKPVDPAKAATAPDAAASASAAQQAGAPVPPGFENSALSRDRVRRSLELDGTSGATSGDTILKGLQKMRGTFDDRHARINEIMSAKTVDTNALLAMQMEVAQYTLLVDVSSKLTGKTTQSFDTLIKGQ